MKKFHDYDKILTRLTVILQRLYEGELLSPSSLAEEFNVSSKTIQRDFNQRLIRFPIEKRGRKWCMVKGHALDKNRSSEERVILSMIEEISEGIGHSFGTKAKNLISKLKNSDENPIYSKIAIEDLSDKVYIFEEIQKSIKNRLIISFLYKDKIRNIAPYKVVSFDGYWYLYGEDLDSNRVKTYYFKDIDKLVVSKNHFKNKSEIIDLLKLAINAWFEPNNNTIEVILLAKSNISKYFYRRPLSKAQRITKRYNNGDIELALKCTSLKEIIHEIKKWMPYLIPLEPMELRVASFDIASEFLKEKQESF